MSRASERTLFFTVQLAARAHVRVVANVLVAAAKVWNSPPLKVTATQSSEQFQSQKCTSTPWCLVPARLGVLPSIFIFHFIFWLFFLILVLNLALLH